MFYDRLKKFIIFNNILNNFNDTIDWHPLISKHKHNKFSKKIKYKNPLNLLIYKILKYFNSNFNIYTKIKT